MTEQTVLHTYLSACRKVGLPTLQEVQVKTHTSGVDVSFVLSDGAGLPKDLQGKVIISKHAWHYRPANDGRDESEDLLRQAVAGAEALKALLDKFGVRPGEQRFTPEQLKILNPSVDKLTIK